MGFTGLFWNGGSFLVGNLSIEEYKWVENLTTPYAGHRLLFSSWKYKLDSLCGKSSYRIARGPRVNRNSKLIRPRKNRHRGGQKRYLLEVDPPVQYISTIAANENPGGWMP